MRSGIGRWLGVVLCGILGMAAWRAGAGDALSGEEFLARVRRPAVRPSYAAMSGESRHVRRGREATVSALYLGIMFNSERTLAQLVIGDREGYFVGQAYAAGTDGCSVIPVNKTGYPDSLLANYGLRPQDLTLAFIYWTLEKELPEESLMTLNCRVFLLRSPDGKEQVRAYLSSKYFFPLKAEWFAGDDTAYETPVRTLEVSSFRKQDDFWLVKNLKLYGPGWLTQINFGDTEAGWIDEENPPRIFKELPGVAAGE